MTRTLAEEDAFDWDADEEVVSHSYGSIAVYLNHRGDIVLRQESTVGDRDERVIIPIGLAEKIAAAITLKSRRS